METDEELLRKPIVFISEKIHTITNCGYTVKDVMVEDFTILGTMIKTYLEEINTGVRAQCQCSYNIVAINSNFINYSLNGYKHLIKHPNSYNDQEDEEINSDDDECDEESVTESQKSKKSKKEKKPKKPKKASSRAKQGNGTSFNSSVSLHVKIMKMPMKPYILKCFPQTGYIQITGVNKEDMSDAKEVIISIIQELFYIKGVLEPNINVEEVLSTLKIGLINYKLTTNMRNKRIILDAHKIYYYLNLGEIIIPNAEIELSPLKICDNKILFKVQFEDALVGKRTQITVKIYYSGKINICGSKCIRHTDIIYEFLYNFFDTYWYDVVAIKMRTDAELLQLNERLARDREKQHELYLKTKEILTKFLGQPSET